MRFKNTKIKYKVGDIRRRIRFAWLPKLCDNFKTTVWLESYEEIKEYNTYISGSGHKITWWKLKERNLISNQGI